MKSFFTLRFCVLASTLMLFSVLSAHAQQAKKISLQGFLKDANGKAVADGQQTITFKLYTVDAGGTAEWTEDQTINVFGGVYSTHLGKTVPLENLNWGAKTYYVGVTVQGTELTPRTELTFAPYSLGSPKAQEVVCSGAVGDIKHSILAPDQFKLVNGDCWVPMDGSTLKTTDKLRQITGMTTLPNGGGLFIRSQEFVNSADHDPNRSSSSPIAQFQEQATQTHQHYASLYFNVNTSGGGEHNHSFAIGENDFKSAGDRSVVEHMGTTQNDVTGSKSTITTTSNGYHSHSVSGYATGDTGNNNGYNSSETRPKNINFWVYIRIN